MTNWAWEGLHDYLLNDGLSDQSKIDLKSRHTNLIRQPKYLKIQHKYFTSGGKTLPQPYFNHQ